MCEITRRDDAANRDHILTTLYPICTTSASLTIFLYETAPLPELLQNDKIGAYRAVLALFHALSLRKSTRLGKRYFNLARLFFSEPSDNPMLNLLEDGQLRSKEMRRELYTAIHVIFGRDVEGWENDVNSTKSYYWTTDTRLTFLKALVFVLTETLYGKDDADPLVKIGNQVIEEKCEEELLTGLVTCTPEWHQISYTKRKGDFGDNVKLLFTRISDDLINLISTRYKLGTVFTFIERQSPPVPFDEKGFQALKKFFSFTDDNSGETLREGKLAIKLDVEFINKIYESFFGRESIRVIPENTIPREVIRRYSIKSVKYNIDAMSQIIEDFFEKTNVLLVQSINLRFKDVLRDLKEPEEPLLFTGVLEKLESLEKLLEDDVNKKFVDVITGSPGMPPHLVDIFRRMDYTIALGGDKRKIVDFEGKLYPIFKKRVEDIGNFPNLDLFNSERINDMLSKLFDEASTIVIFGKSLKDVKGIMQLHSPFAGKTFIAIIISDSFGFFRTKRVNFYLIHQGPKGDVLSIEWFSATDNFMTPPTDFERDILGVKKKWREFPFDKIEHIQQKDIFRLSESEQYLTNSIWYIDCRIKHIPWRGIAQFKNLFENMETYVGKTYFSARIKPVLEAV